MAIYVNEIFVPKIIKI